MADDVSHGLALLDGDALELLAVACRVFAPLARVALSTNAIHGYRQRRMGLCADGTQRHGTGGKAFDDLFGRFHFVDWNGFCGINLEFEQTAQRQVTLALVIDELGVFLVRVPVVGPRAVLQFGNRIRRPHMVFTAHAPSVFTPGFQRIGQYRVVAKSRLVHADGFLGNLKDADTFHAAGRAGEVLVDCVGRQANGFEQLCAAVAHIRRDTHLRHDLGQALTHRFHIVVDGLLGAQIAG